jgi:DNA-binding transcriptional ArsR family regulator
MTPCELSPAERAALSWIARVAATDAGALGAHLELAPATTLRRLRDLRRAGLVDDLRVLGEGPVLWSATRAGCRAVGLARLGGSRLTPASAPHTLACARACAALERRHPDHTALTERELRLCERGNERPLICPEVELSRARGVHVHRPDLVLWPRGGDGLPVAVEVELTAKAPARLREICRAWARCRSVAGVVYYATGPAARAVRRAVDATRSHEAIVVVPLAALEKDLSSDA